MNLTHQKTNNLYNENDTAKFYGLKNDFMFKAVFQKSKEALKNLVSVLLNIDEKSITDIEIINCIEFGKNVDSKDCVLDVKVEINHKEIIDLEMQVRNENNWPERSLLYWSRAYDNLDKGEDYLSLKKTYHIGILDFTLFKENPSFYTKYMIMDTETGYLYSDKLNICILDLTQINNAKKNINPELVTWAKIINANNMKQLTELTNDKEVLKNMAITIRELSEDEKIRQQCQAREDYNRRLIGQYNQGLAEGLAEGKRSIIEKAILYAIENDIPVESVAKMLDLEADEIYQIADSMKDIKE